MAFASRNRRTIWMLAGILASTQPILFLTRPCAADDCSSPRICCSGGRSSDGGRRISGSACDGFCLPICSFSTYLLPHVGLACEGNHVIIGLGITSGDCFSPCTGLRSCVNIEVAISGGDGGSTAFHTWLDDPNCFLSAASYGSDITYGNGTLGSVRVSNIAYVGCGNVPSSFHLEATGTHLDIASDFTLTWLSGAVDAYTENRTYRRAGGNTILIEVTNITGGTYTANVTGVDQCPLSPDCSYWTPVIPSTWGRLKVIYR